jgi:hypothetical protein
MLLCLPAYAAPEWIAVNKAGTGFVTESGAKFTPWGFNYFRDEKYRLLEDYWNSDKPDGWPKFERDFREMKRLGANVVRIHLQFAKFNVEPAGRKPPEIAKAWIRQMTAAIRKHDQRHLITVGLIWVNPHQPRHVVRIPAHGNRARSGLPRSPRLSRQGKGQRRDRFTPAVSGGQADCG